MTEIEIEIDIYRDLDKIEKVIKTAIEIKISIEIEMIQI